MHKELVRKPREYYEKLCNNVKGQQNFFCGVVSSNEASLMASYKVSLRIAKAKKPLNTGELILPCNKDVCLELFGDSSTCKINYVSLSDDAVTKRVEELAEDTEDQLLERSKSSKYFSLQIDEPKDSK